MTFRRFPLVALLFGLAVAPASAETPSRNGFRLERATIPVAEIQRGGPPRDGIPALDHPTAVAPDEAPWRDDEVVLGVAWNGTARAYPVAILDWHELVNDTLGGRPILVTYCPLCGTGIVFDRRVEPGPEATPRTFGVSGLLYRSDLLLYDHQSESLWSQISARAVTGPAAGGRLSMIRSRMSRWGAWRKAHPETTVLSAETGHERRYGVSPYGDYARSERLLFDAPSDPRQHPKMPTIGLRIPGGPARAYPAGEIVRAGGRIEEHFAGRPVSISFDTERETFDVVAPPSVEVIEGFWFAWMAFHPTSSVFVGGEAGPTGTPEPAPDAGASPR